MKRLVALAAAPLTLGFAQAQQPLAFVACPIMRDTASVPCWLAQYQDETYFLVLQEDSSAAVYPPALGHQALIEGTPTGETRCGGKVLSNLRISIRPELDPSCNTIIPASEQHQIADNPRGPGPGNARPVPAAAVTPPRPPALTGSQIFEVFYDFDWQTAGRNTRVIQEAAAYAKANPDAQVNVIGYRAAVRLTGGRVLAEEENIGERRARELVKTLVTLGVDQGTIAERGEPDPEVGDYAIRRAIIAVILGGSEDHSEH